MEFNYDILDEYSNLVKRKLEISGTNYGCFNSIMAQTYDPVCSTCCDFQRCISGSNTVRSDINDEYSFLEE